MPINVFDFLGKTSNGFIHIYCSHLWLQYTYLISAGSYLWEHMYVVQSSYAFIQQFQVSQLHMYIQLYIWINIAIANVCWVKTEDISETIDTVAIETAILIVFLVNQINAHGDRHHALEFKNNDQVYIIIHNSYIASNK